MIYKICLFIRKKSDTFSYKGDANVKDSLRSPYYVICSLMQIVGNFVLYFSIKKWILVKAMTEM